MSKTVVACGEILWDILPSGVVLGGAPFNFVYRINSLGDLGIMVSRLGSDDLGRQAYEKVVSLGLETNCLQWDDLHPTGTVNVSFDSDNNPDYVIVTDVAYDSIEPRSLNVEAAQKADCFCFGTLIQRSEKSRSTVGELLDHAGSSMKFLDINFRKNCYDRESVLYSLDKAEVLKLNEDEVHELARMLNISSNAIPEFCEEVLSRFSLRYCLVTLEKMGAFAMSDSGEKKYSPGYRVKLVDSLGSGDAFSAGFIHSILRGASLHDACEAGNVLGAMVAEQRGATAPITIEDIKAFRTGRLERNTDQRVRPFG